MHESDLEGDLEGDFEFNSERKLSTVEGGESLDHVMMNGSDNEDETIVISTNSDTKVDTGMLRQFQDYSQWAHQNLLDFDPDERASVELMSVINKRRVPLVIYKDLVRWHKNNLKAKS